MEFASKLMERTSKGYVSYSALKYAADGSRQQDMKLFELYMRGLLKKESDALTFGGLYDTLLLEPETLTDKYHIIYDEKKIEELSERFKNPRASKQYKDWVVSESEQALSEGKEVVSEDMMNQAESMIVRLDESEVLDMTTGEIKLVRQYLKGKTQYEINDWIGDVPIRGFLDVLGDGFISDSKTTRDLYGFKWDIDKFCYDIQAYIYCEAMQTDTFYWVVQTKSVPYTCAVYKASELTIKRGETKFWSAIDNIRTWLDKPEKDTNTFAIFSTI
tara:strand:+ start:1307 stop:2128 length:822 start_codon:yes stop_codon:yes gene_type:complete